MNIGEKIKEARKARGISQRALAFETGLSQAGISYIENGHNSPTTDTLETIANVLDMSIELVPRCSSAGYVKSITLHELNNLICTTGITIHMSTGTIEIPAGMKVSIELNDLGLRMNIQQ